LEIQSLTSLLSQPSELKEPTTNTKDQII